MLCSVLPFDVYSDTEKTVLICGFGPRTFSLPLHRVNLQSQLVQGEVTLCLCPTLPVDGVTVVIGNNLAGSHVFASSIPPLVISESPSLPEEHDVLAGNPPEVFAACVITRAALRAAKEQDVDGEACGAPESWLLWEKLPSLVRSLHMNRRQIGLYSSLHVI